MKNAKKRPGKPGTPEISQRIRDVLEREWSGNVQAMAGELGVSYMGLTRALKGSNPQASLLTALVEKAHVDSKWLLTGRSTTAADFGLSGNVQLLPISTTLIPFASLRESIAHDWPRLPLITSRQFREAYCFQLTPGLQCLLEPELALAAADLLIVQAPDDSIEYDPLAWAGSWVVFVKSNGTRAALGWLDGDGLIRAAGDKEAKYRLGPDSTFGPAGGLHKREKKTSTQYGVEIGGVTALFRDFVVGQVIARLAWKDEYLAPVSLVRSIEEQAKEKDQTR